MAGLFNRAKILATCSTLICPLGVTIVGGLLLSQVLTLYTTPVIYLQVEWLRQKMGFGARRAISVEKALEAEPAR